MEQKCSFINLIYIKYLCSCYMSDSYLAYKCIHTSTCDRFTLYTSHPAQSMPFHKDTHMAVLDHLWKYTWPNILAIGNETQRSIAERWVHSRISWTWEGDSRNLKLELLRFHTCSTYIQYNRGTGPNSGTADTTLKREKAKNGKLKHSYTQTKDRTTARILLTKAGWSCRLSRQPKWECTWKNLF